MLETLSAIAAFFATGIGFWLALIVLAVVITLFSEEDGAKATITLVLGALFLQFVAKFDLLSLLREQPFTLLLYAAIYVAIGFGFACVKWWRYAKKQRRKYDQFRAAFFRKNHLEGDVLPAEFKERFLEQLKGSYKPNSRGFEHYSDSSDADPVIPDITKNKAAFIRWMTYWPFSLVFTLLNDPVRRLFEWLYEVAGKKMQEIANSVFAGTERDRLTKDDEAEIVRKREEADRKQRDDREFHRGGR